MISVVVMKMLDGATTRLVTGEVNAAAVLHLRLGTSGTLDGSGISVARRACTDRLSVILVFHRGRRMSAGAQRRA